MSKKVSYVATEEKVEGVGIIYRRRVAGKGRPALFVKKGDRYAAWKRPIVVGAKKVKAVKAVVETPAVETPAPVTA